MTPGYNFRSAAFILFAALARDVVGQAPPPTPSTPSWAVPGARGPEARIYRTWRDYLDSKEGHYSRYAWKPSPFWLAAEQTEWQVYDLAALYLPDGARPEVVSIRREPGRRREYRIVTVFHADDENNAMRSRDVRSTVFAVPHDTGWVIANALPRLTRTWRRDTVGFITYVIEPGYRYDRARARQATAFVDSVATAFGVPRPEPLTYYLASTMDEVCRILGLEVETKQGPTGGLAQPVNRLLLSGIPAVGEDYRHELTHLIVLPLIMGHPTTYLVSEGVPTWLGGTTGMDFPTAARGLAQFLTEHPEITLDSLLEQHFPVAQFYPTGGVVAMMAYRQGGTEAVKALFDAGPTTADFRAGVERIFKRPWAEFVVDWRAQALSFMDPETR